MIIIAILLPIAGLLWIYWSKIKKIDRMTSSLPSPPALPVLGSSLLFIGDTQKILRNLEDIAELSYKTGSSKLWIGPKLYIAIANPEDAQVVLENCLDKDIVYRFLQPWLGQGLFLAPVALWKLHRKVLLPVFHNKIVEQYLGIMGEQCDVLVQRLEEQVGLGKFDVFRYVTACTLDIVFESAMGEIMDVQHSPDTPYMRARHAVMTILNMRLFKLWLQPDCLFNLTPYAKEQRDNIHITHQFTDEVVKKRRQEYEKRKALSDDGDNNKRTKFGSVLDMLFGREIEFTDEQLREHIDSITIAGNDTTALVIAYTLVLLGIHQDVQQKVYNELYSIFGDSKRQATKDDIFKMQYLERVIKESMRLYTVAPIIARNIDKDTYLPKCGVLIPAGCGAVVGAFAIHRNKAVWGPDVDEFNPDRFLPENSVHRHPAAFIPFSYGARNCIGRNYGMLILKSIISRIVRSYMIEADEIGPLRMELLIFPIRGHQIKIHKR